ncbi:MAG: hypothetical protein K6F67_06045 [Oscillospiraceae bacterium]|nr:hypothetical protein [Oscillospiraceae bacterium]
MDKKLFYSLAERTFEGVKDLNVAHMPVEGVDLPILDAPIIGFAAADDPLFDSFKDPQIIGSNFLTPLERMPEAKTVVVFYFSFTEEIRSRHRACTEAQSEAWNEGYGGHGKVVVAFAKGMMAALENEGVGVVNPTWDMEHPTTTTPFFNGDEDDLAFNVPWSTRHVAFVAGLGTFGVHKHIITEKGCCGAMVTLLLDCELEPTPRAYTDPYEYCSHCGACTTRCPLHAITMEHLRNLKKCAGRTRELMAISGKGNCAKCMVGVPCEAGIPTKHA